MTTIKELRDYYYKQMKSHSQFKDLTQFNRYTQKLRYNFKSKLNSTDYALIDFLAKHAVKAAMGVACPKVLTMAKAINRSSDTVGRIVRKLEQLGIIKRVYNMRVKKGGNGANFYIFQRGAIGSLEDVNAGAVMQGREKQENLDGSKVENSKSECKTNINIKLNNNINIEKNKESTTSVFKELLTYKYIQKRLTNVYAPSFANKLWRRIIWAFRNSELYEVKGFYYLQDLLDKEIELERKIANTIALCTERHKKNSINKTFEGYLYTAMLNLFNNIAVKLLEEYTTINKISLEEFFSRNSIKEDPNKNIVDEQRIKEFYGDDWTLEIY